MKKTLRLLALCVALCMALALAACGGNSGGNSGGNGGSTTSDNTTNDSTTNDSTTSDNDAAQSDTSGGGSEAKRAVFCSAMNNESQAFALKMFQKHMADYNITVDVLDDQGDSAKQADNVGQAVAQGYDWIIVNPADAAGIVTSLRAAKQANPDVLISTYSADVPDGDSQQYRDFFVGIDDTMAGQQAAQAFLDLFPDGAKVVEVGGQAGHNAQILRHDGYVSVMADHPEFELIASQNTEHWAADEAQSIMEDFIMAYGDQIDAVFCHWDNGATGCINAMKANGMDDVPIVGVDGCRAGFDQVNDGDQYATIMNNFEADSLTSLELATKWFNGESVDSVNFITPDVVTLDNINDFTTPEW